MGRVVSKLLLPLLPMAPTLTKPPFQRLSSWGYEEKVDGWRMLAYRDDTSVRASERLSR